jgi:hypothetical protein
MEDVSIIYGHLVYVSAIWYIFHVVICWSFGVFFPFCDVVPRKIWATLFHPIRSQSYDFLTNSYNASVVVG